MENSTFTIQKQNKIKGKYNLISDGENLGYIGFDKKFSYNATAIFGNKSLEISRRGFLKPYISIKTNNVDNEFIKIKLGLNKFINETTVKLSELQFRNIGFLENIWSWLDEKGESIMDFKANYSGDSLGEVIIKNNAQLNDMNNILAVMGWYLILTFKSPDVFASALVTTN